MLLDHINARARAHPGRTAIVQNGTAISYASFARGIAAARNLFAAAGLPAKGIAIVRTSLLADSWGIVLGLHSLGIDTIAVPSLDKIADLQLQDVVCIVAWQSELARDELHAPMVAGKRLILLTKDMWDGATGQVPESEASPRPVGGHIVYTSGTTGTSKKLLIGADLAARRIARNSANLAWPEEPVVHFNNFGLWTSVGYNYPQVVWNAGGRAIFDQRQDALAHFLESDFDCGYLTPVLAQQLVLATKEMDRPARDIVVRIAGGPLSRDVVEALQRKVARNVVTTYGSSECQAMLRSLHRSPEEINWWTVEADRVAEIVDENGRRRADGDEGELRIRLLDCDCSSYLDDPDITARIFRDGWFHPGDLAVRRADGRIRILGRVGDVLNVGGSKFAVGPIEQHVQEILGVAGVCLFSRLDDAGRDELVVAFEAARDPSRDRLQRIATEFRTFTHVRFARFAAFPHMAEGLQKINRNELRRAVFDPAKDRPGRSEG
jgi:acyl-coenzyme A synthetase/AMP-(fatty) acid ligase